MEKRIRVHTAQRQNPEENRTVQEKEETRKHLEPDRERDDLVVKKGMGR